MLLGMPTALPSMSHTVCITGDIGSIRSDVIAKLQLSMDDVIGCTTPELLGGPDATYIVYDRGNIAAPQLPKDRVAQYDATTCNMWTHGANAERAYVPPLINTMALWGSGSRPASAPYVIAVPTTAPEITYPVAEISAILDTFKNVQVQVSISDSTPQEWLHKYGSRVIGVPTVCGVNMHMANSNLVVCGASHRPHPYSRTCIEAMAMGRPVICPRLGVFARRHRDKQDCVMFDRGKDMASLLDAVSFIISSSSNTVSTIAESGRLTASGEDMVLHMHALKRIINYTRYKQG